MCVIPSTKLRIILTMQVHIINVNHFVSKTRLMLFLYNKNHRSMLKMTLEYIKFYLNLFSLIYIAVLTDFESVTVCTTK